MQWSHFHWTYVYPFFFTSSWLIPYVHLIYLGNFVLFITLDLFFYYRLSGLIVDVFGNLAVIASSAAWVEKYKSEIQFYISRISEINHIKWRPSVDILKEEGLELSDPGDSNPIPSLEKVKVRTSWPFFSFLIADNTQTATLYLRHRASTPYATGSCWASRAWFSFVLLPLLFYSSLVLVYGLCVLWSQRRLTIKVHLCSVCDGEVNYIGYLLT